jgi:hypothetical protein
MKTASVIQPPAGRTHLHYNSVIVSPFLITYYLFIFVIPFIQNCHCCWKNIHSIYLSI